jgi:hypothetical protein
MRATRLKEIREKRGLTQGQLIHDPGFSSNRRAGP